MIVDVHGTTGTAIPTWKHQRGAKTLPRLYKQEFADIDIL